MALAMSVLSVFDGSARALEIVKIVSRHEWSFLSQLLRRFSSDDLVFALQLEGLESLRATFDRLSRRVALAILVAALLLSATLMASLAQQDLLRDVSEGLFIGANLFGLWLLVSLLRSNGR